MVYIVHVACCSSNWFIFNFCSETVELSCCLSIFFTKICFNLQFLCNTIKNMIKLKPRKQTNFNHQLLCCLIVKLTGIVYKNITYGNLIFTGGWIVFEQTLRKLNMFRNKHFVLKQWVNTALYFILTSLKLDSPIIFICRLTFFFLREREGERKRVSLVRNNFSSNVSSETIELCCQPL